MRLVFVVWGDEFMAEALFRKTLGVSGPLRVANSKAAGRLVDFRDIPLPKLVSGALRVDGISRSTKLAI